MIFDCKTRFKPFGSSLFRKDNTYNNLIHFILTILKIFIYVMGSIFKKTTRVECDLDR